MARRTRQSQAQQEQQEQSQVATFVNPERVKPEDRKGKSTLANPVGNTWVMCINATAKNDGTPPKRTELVKQVIEAGVAYYTARTQVNAYLAWERAGRPEGRLPRGVTIGS